MISPRAGLKGRRGRQADLRCFGATDGDGVVGVVCSIEQEDIGSPEFLIWFTDGDDAAVGKHRSEVGPWASVSGSRGDGDVAAGTEAVECAIRRLHERRVVDVRAVACAWLRRYASGLSGQ